MDSARHEERAGTSLAQPFTGNLKESARGEDQETLAPNCGGRAQDHATHLGYHP